MRSHTKAHEHQPVLVLPGFLAHDVTTTPLRMVIADRDYPVYGWNRGINIGPTDPILNALRARLHAIAERHGASVAIVGWSLGGLYARELAREFPDEVRQVVTLASPMNLGIDMPHCSRAHALFERLRPFYSRELAEIGRPETEKPELGLPTTAVYTRSDEVVPWQTCIDPHTAPHQIENIEVRGTHVGLMQNHAVAHLVLDRLEQPLGHWQPFVPDAAHAHHYPSHAQHGLERSLSR